MQALPPWRARSRQWLLAVAAALAAVASGAVAQPQPAASQAASAAAARPLRIATGEFPPYATASRPDQGLALAVVRRAFELAGRQVQFHFLPWPRALAETRDGRWDASAHWGVTPERKRDFLLSDNLYTERWLLLHRRDMPLDWRRIDDLRPYRLGLVPEYTYTPELWLAARAGRLRYEQPRNDVISLRMLLLGRIDVLPLDRNVACDTLAYQFTPAEAQALSAHPRPLNDQFTTHVLFPPALADSEALRTAFNRGLAQLRASGEHRRMTRAAVACPAHWPPPE
jgi:polar amino acid transport system substrate-binding protein